MLTEFSDFDLGKVIVKYNTRAKRIIARRRDDQILLTVPSYYTEKQIRTAFSSLKPQILKLKSPAKIIFNKYLELNTLTFQLRMEESQLNNIYHKLENGILTISYPSKLDIEEEKYQIKIKSIIEAYLRSEAKRVIPCLIKEEASKHNFEFSDVKINQSQSRWGSCSIKKSINISYWCLLLPSHLVNYVILHELCHTLEMNHGPAFWAHLDRVTNKKAQDLTQELKKHHTRW